MPLGIRSVGMVTWYFINSMVLYLFVDGLGHVFERGPFDANVELREVAQQVENDGYYYVPVHFSSQFIPYIYKSTMRVATLQWAGILGSWYLLDETMDHLTGDRDKNSSILHTQPASKKENIDRRPLQGLDPRKGGECPYLLNRYLCITVNLN